MDEDALQEAWDNPQKKDECSVRMNDLEWDYCAYPVLVT
jgi:hypothetical protein